MASSIKRQLELAADALAKQNDRIADAHIELSALRKERRAIITNIRRLKNGQKD